MKTRHYQDLVRLFNTLFQQSYQTVLVKGGEEPIYLPADADNEYHRIFFARGFYASALHEVSHWCIAGKQRRLQTDFGYWYYPEGRDQAQQRSFEAVEVKPQALEWIFSNAAGKKFHISQDNFDQRQANIESFVCRVRAQARHYIRQGLPKRAMQFAQALADYYGTADPAWKRLSCYESGHTLFNQE